MPALSSTTSPILDECNHLQDVQSALADLWQEELNLYEQNESNRPNCTGTVDNENIFPYNTALYPLLDCYDNIRDAKSTANNIIRPSPAPMPFHYFGHRRSKFSPRRLDRHGLRIEEIDALDGHLPNSSWAIQQLMPQRRKAQFEIYESQMRSSDESDNQNGQNEVLPPHHHHNNTRFWNILMNPTVENGAISSDISVPPDDNDAWEENDDVNDSEEWEDIDENTAGDGGGKAKHARDFTFLRWWQHTIAQERKGVINGAGNATLATSIEEMSSLHDDASTLDFSSPESLYNNSPSATLILLKVLKHSLSDLQREYRLARAVLLLIADWRLCDDDDDQDRGGQKGEGMNGIECLRQVLTIISSEYVPCAGYCHETHIAEGGPDGPDHYCKDVSLMILLGMLWRCHSQLLNCHNIHSGGSFLVPSQHSSPTG